MKIVIDISDGEYEAVKSHPGCFNFAHAILNGTPLPKGHGDLIDTINLKAKMFDLPQQPEGSYWDGVDDVGDLIDNAPTIIAADMAERSEKE